MIFNIYRDTIPIYSIKGIVHKNIYITHLQVLPNLYDLLSHVKHKRRYLEKHKKREESHMGLKQHEWVIFFFEQTIPSIKTK